MSQIGRKIINIPDDVNVTNENNNIIVKGKLGELSHQFDKEMNIDIKSAALRVFSNAEGAYGSNVSHLIDTSSWDNEEELADTFNNRKGFAYGLDGKCTKQSELLSSAFLYFNF